MRASEEPGLTEAMPARERLLGVFDSGVGGLTVLKELWRTIPEAGTIYLGDTGRVPYGTKSAETVTRYAVQIAEFLAARGVELLVVACNTASSVALPELEKRFDIPVVGVVAPGVRGALRETRSGRIGVIGTEGTIRADAYGRALRGADPKVEVFSAPCPLFVPLAEQHWVHDDVAYLVARRYLAPLREARVDTLILGCTHYPLLRGTIQDVMGPDVRLIDSAVEAADEVGRALDALPPPAAPRPERARRLFTTDLPDRFVRIGSEFLGEDIRHTEFVALA